MKPVPQIDVRAWPAPTLLTMPPRGSVLCFAPHPDDEVIGPGGTLALHAAAGDPVRVIVATDGAAGDPQGFFPAEELRAIRRRESLVALARLGVPAPVHWGLPDAHEITANDVAHVAAHVANEIGTSAPDTIYVPWPGEHNADHRGLCAAVLSGCRSAGSRARILGYEVWSPLEPSVLIDITAVADRKRAAINCYESQLRYVDYAHVILGLNAYRSLHAGRGRGFVEAFLELAP